MRLKAIQGVKVIVLKIKYTCLTYVNKTDQILLALHIVQEF